VRMMASICRDKAVQKVASLLNPNTPFLVRKSAANSSRNDNVMETSSLTITGRLGVAANRARISPSPHPSQVLHSAPYGDRTHCYPSHSPPPSSQKYPRGASSPVSRLLTEKGTNIEAVDSDGRTPLHPAIRGGLLAIALLIKGANIEAVDNVGLTPLLRPS